MEIHDPKVFQEVVINASHRWAVLVVFSQRVGKYDESLEVSQKFGCLFSSVCCPTVSQPVIAIYFKGKVHCTDVTRVTWGELTAYQKICAALNSMLPNALKEQSKETIVADPRYFADPEKPIRPDYLDKIDSLIGAQEFKDEIRRITNFVTVSKKRKAKGLKDAPFAMNYIFEGRPGLGKTTCARLLGSHLKFMGVLPRGQLVEVSRADLVAGYIGQTAIKTMARLQEALGGVLFIDEFYTLLVKDMERDFGKEAVDTIMKFIEDHRGEICVVIAGYAKPMKDAIALNPGLKSRFTQTIRFNDMSIEDLADVFSNLLHEQEQRLADDAAFAAVGEAIRFHYAQRGDDFGNARDMRTFCAAIDRVLCDRVAQSGSEDTQTVIAADVEQAARLIGMR